MRGRRCSSRTLPILVLLALPLVAVAPFSATEAAAAADCAWSSELAAADLWNVAESMAVWDDGNGEALYVGGGFPTAGGQEVGFVARWDGSSWSPLAGPSGLGADSSVWALAVYDDGDGSALYVAGAFSQAGGLAANHIARWDGAVWSVLPGPGGVGVSSWIHDLEVFDDGSGPVLVAAGRFQQAGGAPASRIAAWDGTSWAPLGSGIEGPAVRALEVWDDGDGPALYAAGEFTHAGGVAAQNVARWDGSTWSALHGPGGNGIDGEIGALQAFDDGGGPALYAAGSFLHADGVDVRRLARWDGAAWSGLSGPSAMGVDDSAIALTVHDDGGGPALWIGGFFTEIGGVPGRRLARWNGNLLSVPAAGGANGSIRTLASWNDGGGSALYAGGVLTEAGGVAVSRIARLAAGSWSRLGGAVGHGFNGVVRTFAIHDDGTGPSLYAGGFFTRAGDADVSSVARWTGGGWAPVVGPGGGGPLGEVRALAVYDDGGGTALFAAGGFATADGVAATGIARWNGTAWSALDPANQVAGQVFGLAVFDDGGGEALYAGGNFFAIGGQEVGFVARWNGSGWSPLGGPQAGTNSLVLALETWDDGNGPALYVGGNFSSAGGVTASDVARWDGSAWSALEGAGGNGVQGSVRALEELGGRLCVGGAFSAAGGVPASNVACWDGDDWSALSGSAGSGVSSTVHALATFDDGTGSALYAGGEFGNAGGIPSNGIARWDGEEWSPLFGPGGPGVFGRVYGLAAFSMGGDPALWAGGELALAGGLPSSYAGAWICQIIFADGFESGDTTAWSSTTP